MTRLLILAACALLMAGCGGSAARSPERTPSGGGTSALPELTDMRQLQAAFDAHSGVPRLVILLSPT